jgi:hypothetical protein
MSKSQIYVSHVMRSVPGWFYDQDVSCFLAIDHLQVSRRANGALVEVGVYCGKSLGLMSTFRRTGEKLYAVDLYKTQGSLERAKDTVQRAVGGLDDVAFITANSLEISPAKLRAMIPQEVRFLHIDAGHEYDEALSDLKIFGAITSPDAVIAVDDYFDRDFPGVCAATLEFMRESEFMPFLSGLMKLYLCRADRLEDYVRGALALPVFQQNVRIARFKDRPMVIAFSPKPLLHQENMDRLDFLFGKS